METLLIIIYAISISLILFLLIRNRNKNKIRMNIVVLVLLSSSTLAVVSVVDSKYSVVLYSMHIALLASALIIAVKAKRTS